MILLNAEFSRRVSQIAKVAVTCTLVAKKKAFSAIVLCYFQSLKVLDRLWKWEDN